MINVPTACSYKHNLKQLKRIITTGIKHRTKHSQMYYNNIVNYVFFLEGLRGYTLHYILATCRIVDISPLANIIVVPTI